MGNKLQVVLAETGKVIAATRLGKDIEQINAEVATKAPAHGHPYRPDNWVPSYDEVTGKPTFDWAKIFSESGNAVIPDNMIPSIALSDTYIVANEAEQLALTVQKGDIAIRSDEKKTYIALNGTNGTMTDWAVFKTPTDSVLTVDGRTGNVTLGDVYAALSHTHGPEDLPTYHAVATSGNYNDLNNKPDLSIYMEFEILE